MEAPPPRSAPTTAPMAKPASHPLPRERVCGTPSIGQNGMLFGFVVFVLLLFGCALMWPNYDATMKVASLSVSNLSPAASTGATWKATFLAERPEEELFSGSFLFRDIKVFIYHHWDTAIPLAVSLVEPFELRGAASTVIKAKMRMERPETEVAEDMNRERRSVGMVIVGLEVRMRVTYLYESWWKRSFGHVQARCDDLRIVFANSTVEGSSGSTVEGGLVTRYDPVTGGNTPDINLPPCTLIY